MPKSSARVQNPTFIEETKRRRRWSTEQKLALIRRTTEPGASVSLVAREAGISASQLFQWRRAYLDGELTASGSQPLEPQVSELHEARKRILQLEAALGRMTLENELLKEALALAKSRL